MGATVCTRCLASVGPEQHRCPQCDARLGFVPELGMLCAFEDRGEAGWHPLGIGGLGVRLPCGNYGEHPICHWTVPAEASDCFCESCRCVARTPRLSGPAQRQRWTRFGRARRQLFIGLRRLGLLDGRGRLRGLPEPLFDVVDESPAAAGAPAVRGDARGPIIVDLSRIDALGDRDLFEALRRAIGLRLCLAPTAIAHPSADGRIDVDRAIAEWESRWARLDAERAREAPRARHGVPASTWRDGGPRALA